MTMEARFSFRVCFFMKVAETNWVPLALSGICILNLIVVKLYIDPKTRPKLKFPIPIELILASTLCSVIFKVQLCNDV